jgi:hypothetical protein
MPNRQAQLTRLEDESPELVIRGPFGGILSQVAPDLAEQSGFYDVRNILFNKAGLTTRPALTQVAATGATLGSNSYLQMIAAWFDAIGGQHENVIQGGKLYYASSLNPIAWTALTPSTGSITNSGNLLSWTVVNGLLCFCQGADVIWTWDGNTGHDYQPASATAPSAFYLQELNSYCIAANVSSATGAGISGGPFPQMVMTSLPGDPTSWGTGTSIPGTTATNLADSLGPIMGMGKIYGNIYILRHGGYTQMSPTGNGLAPFSYDAFGDKGKGTRFPKSLAVYGEEEMVYVGDENIWDFNGSIFTPIGDFPSSDGRSRIGARDAIYADLTSGLSSLAGSIIFGFITSNLALGQAYKAYWLFCGDSNLKFNAWCFNFYEQNWTKYSFPDFSASGTPTVFYPVIMGEIVPTAFSYPDGLLVGDINGLIGQLGTGAGTSLPSTECESPAYVSGNLVFQDRKHNKRIDRIRITYGYNDWVTSGELGNVNLGFSLTNERGETAETVNLILSEPNGTFNTSQICETVIPIEGPNINGSSTSGSTAGFSGLQFQYTITFNVDGNSNIIKIYEIAFIYELNSEYKNPNFGT